MTVFKHNVGDTVYVSSRYEGVVKVTIISQITIDDMPFYELSELVSINRNGDQVGAAQTTEYEELWGTYEERPCPESLLMVGENVVKDL